MGLSSVTERAYAYCESVTRVHARSFFFAARFLPPQKRRAVFPIYAFCRHVDDAVDIAEGTEDQKRRVVATWQTRLGDVFAGNVCFDEAAPTDQDLVFIAWRDVLSHYRFDESLPLELIRGVVQDTEINRYETFDDLYRYCYRVASTVGLMSSEILGYSDRKALANAEALGIAMQLTNILRDVGEDAERDRIYLPREDLERFGVSESQILAGEISREFASLVKFEIERARKYYLEGDAGIAYLEPDSRVTVGLASTVYAKILREIEKQRYDVFTRRARTSTASKLLTVPRVYLRWRA
jgi:phytoene synthase